MRKMWIGASAIVLVLAGLYGGWRVVSHPTVVTSSRGLPDEFPEQGFSHRAFEELLERFVKDGHTDYAAWHTDDEAREQLDEYLAALAAYSPESHPARFATKSDEMAYWIYAYNAFVIRAILDRWPLDSVTDVKAPVEVVKGFGFFYTLEFVVGGQRTNLYDLENKKLRKRYGDPRIHFALNCGSAGCPKMKPKLPTGAALEAYLSSAEQEFINEPRNVTIDHDQREVRVSAIFEWYEEDFVAEVQRKGAPSAGGVLAYLRLVSTGLLNDELARTEGYTLRFVEYDWSVNNTGDDRAEASP